jgi:ADP-ribosyl-[dinitrogen reductase] hydrolase
LSSADTFRRRSTETTLASIPPADHLQDGLAADRFAGALVGMAVGDAFAAPVEFLDRARVKKLYPDGLKHMRKSDMWDAGEYTDDTQMALLTADSLLQHGELRPQDLAARFRTWARTAKDVGKQTRRVMNMAGHEESPESCAKRDYEQHPENSAGNGAVMRCTPIALFHAHSPSMLLADSRRSARVTHGDPKAQASCVLLNAAIVHFLRGGGKDNPWQHGMKFLTPFERDEWSRLSHLPILEEREIQSGGYTVSTVEAAFWSFQHSESFEEAIELAASLGHDADTVAAVTGALAGAYYGYSAIPAGWRSALKDEERIHQTALNLGRAVSNSNPTN